MSWQEQEQIKVTAFWDDLYLYDLNSPDSMPIAYRCARAGERQPTFLELLGISSRDWLQLEDRLYSLPVCLARKQGAILIPLFGNIGRFLFVIVPKLTPSALAYLAQSGVLGEVYLDEQLGAVRPNLTASDREAFSNVLNTVTILRCVIRDCEQELSELSLEDCILRCASLFGVELMSPDTAELAALQGQRGLPEMHQSGQVCVLFFMTMLSLMRNRAHARSGWLYVSPTDNGYALQACMRLPHQANTESSARLRTICEDSGVPFGIREESLPIKPPKQYAYMHKKITDPRHPFCARCGCLDARCADCTVLQWAVLPCTSDAALLGIKNYFVFEA